MIARPDPMSDKSQKRCPWSLGSALMTRYHDREWGVPVHDDRKHFEFLVLDAAQAGLSWEIILRKRENYRKAFDGFDPEKISRYGPKKIKDLLKNPGIIRNRLKIHSAVANAKGFLAVQKEFGSFDRYIWKFVDGKTEVSRFRTMKELPAKTKTSEAMSKDLLGRGFRFVGPTICYAYMQAAGLVNDHLVGCFRRREVRRH